MQDVIYKHITFFFGGKPNIDVASLMKELNEIDNTELQDLFSETYELLLISKEK